MQKTAMFYLQNCDMWKLSKLKKQAKKKKNFGKKVFSKIIFGKKFEKNKIFENLDFGFRKVYRRSTKFSK